jgi:hypothetical protein
MRYCKLLGVRTRENCLFKNIRMRINEFWKDNDENLNSSHGPF